jgi:hydrogenase expression/formation protein HypD
LDAVQTAKNNPEKEIVFFAVGFETTAPANALAVLQASKMGLKNFSILVSHVLVPPAMEAILGDEFNNIQAFLAAGHVCTVMGYSEYLPIAEKYKIPVIVTGFEPVDLLLGIEMAVNQLEEGAYKVENQYSRVVNLNGNEKAKEIIFEIFEIGDCDWRGIGTIPMSGYVIRGKYNQFNAALKFNVHRTSSEPDNGCISGEIMKGKKKPFDCPQFGKACTPSNPLGAPMVSSEGACSAYFKYKLIQA